MRSCGGAGGMADLMGEGGHLNTLFICICFIMNKIQYSAIHSRADCISVYFWIFSLRPLFGAWNLFCHQDCSPCCLTVSICLRNLCPPSVFSFVRCCVFMACHVPSTELGFHYTSQFGSLFGLRGRLGPFGLMTWLLCLLWVLSSVVITECLIFTVSRWKEGPWPVSACMVGCVCVCVVYRKLCIFIFFFY